MKNKKLTLIIPFFNENQKIIRSMKIILSQISKPDEIIFINNSSKDNSEIKLKLFIKSINLKFKNNIKIINNKKSLPSTAKNLGVKIAKHNYVVFFDIGLSTNNYFIYKRCYLYTWTNLWTRPVVVFTAITGCGTLGGS